MLIPVILSFCVGGGGESVSSCMSESVTDCCEGEIERVIEGVSE